MSTTPRTDQQRNSIRRSTTKVHVVIVWPGDGPEWEAMPKDTRNAIRSHMDAICDIIELHLP